jgi:uncharacterized protein (TIGR04255 family)
MTPRIGSVTNWYDRDGLPKFSLPPVVEAALAVEYSPVPGLDFFQLTRLQSAWETRYPQIRDVPGAPPTEPRSDGSLQFLFQFGDAPKRMWASNPVNGLLVQTQNDRLVLNWRKAESEEAYPGYARLRTEYVRLWDQQAEYLAKGGLLMTAPILAEYTYVNNVPLADGDSLATVVTVVQQPPEELPGKDLFGRFQFIRDIVESETDPYPAQIHITGEPAVIDGQRTLAFTIIARVILGDKADHPLDGLDAAHALASHTFARIVTREKQEAWGRLA